MRADVAVIGGGAAGLMAAGTAAEHGLKVVIVEPNERYGQKLRITGKGRCNVTNHCDVRTFLANVVSNPKFLYSAATAFSPSDVMDFFEDRLGVPLKTERGGRVFPVSDNAHDIADALSRWCETLGVGHVYGRAAGLAVEDGRLRGVVTSRGMIPCAAAIVCTGGKSCPSTGSTGDGYALAASVGHTVVPPRPSLVPLISSAPYCAELAGFSPRNVDLTVYEDGKAVYTERGEMLFAYYGVTGPLVLTASAHMRWGEKKYDLSVDFKPALDSRKLDERILRDLEKFKNRDMGNALGELLPRSLIPVMLRLAQIPPETKAHDLTRAQRQALGQVIKALPVPVSGPWEPANSAIVTGGGVDVRQIDPRTMGSKLVRGLYFAGEVLDVDAYTGGYNLQIAWSTGRCAGRAVGKERPA